MMSKTRIAILSAALLCGCAGEANTPTGYAFSVEPDLSDAFALGAGNIEKASGIPVLSSPYGAMVRWAEPGDKLDDDDCAGTVVTFDGKTRRTSKIEILVSLDAKGSACGNLARTIEHELIHALRDWTFSEVDQNEGHSEHGVFQAHVVSGDRALEETSLSALCERAECPLFAPEGQ